MKLPKLKTRGIVCGSFTTAIVTLLVAGEYVPIGWREPASIAALTGILATLAAAFGLCEHNVTPKNGKDDDGRFFK